MSEDASVPAPITGDGFDEGGRDAGRLIKGTILRCVDGHWADRDGLAPPETLLALGTALALQRWEDGLPAETIVKEPGKDLPDIDELNGQVPRERWEEGINGPRPPWVLQHVVYLINGADASMFTYINSTIGAAIAVGELKDRVRGMRVLRGAANVCPIVKLDSRPLRTRYGAKMRPHFAIVEWRELGPSFERRPAPQLEHNYPADYAGKVSNKPGKKVEEPSLAEEIDDTIPWNDDISDVGKS
jgi:hypothetical protein